VSADWAAIASAINQRMAELGMSQANLIKRSGVSKAVVGEIVRNSAHRRRSPRTLESLSVALDLHPQHLQAILLGHQPPVVGEPVYRFTEDDLPARLVGVEHQLKEVIERLNEIGGRIKEMDAKLSSVVDVAWPNR
jgi:transcriptional regulator with XRE-family HTH domain